MIEIYDISKYLPIDSGIPDADTYGQHHISELEKCLENNLFSSAYFHVHSIYMLFVYFQLFRISKEKNLEFSYSLVGFPRDEKHLLEINKGPFLFSPVNEKTVFRFFRLVDFDDDTISNISDCVNMRNDHMHVNGILSCNTEEKLSKILDIYEKNMEKIFDKQKKFLSNIYSDILVNFTEDDFDPKNADDINLNLLISGQFSYRELDYIKTLETNHQLTKFIIDNY